jgi:hypothetical protein
LQTARGLGGVRRAALVTVGVAALAIAAWRGFEHWNRPAVRVRLVDISGFTDEIPVWMRWRFALELANTGTRTESIDRIHVALDLQDFNEAYSGDQLKAPIPLEPGASIVYRPSLMLLNAAQLAERSYPMIVRVQLAIRDRNVEFDFPTEFTYSRDPKLRTLRRVDGRR